MGGFELPVVDVVAIPLADELAGPVQLDDARRARLIGGIGRLGVVGALIAMALGDVDVAVPAEGEHHRLPQQALALGLVPVAAMAGLADGHQELAVRAHLLQRGEAGVDDPDIVLGVHGHAVGLVVMADHIVADAQDQPVVAVIFEELRQAEGLALEHPEIVPGIQRDGGHAAGACGQVDGIGEA